MVWVKNLLHVVINAAISSDGRIHVIVITCFWVKNLLHVVINATISSHGCYCCMLWVGSVLGMLEWPCAVVIPGTVR